METQIMPGAALGVRFGTVESFIDEMQARRPNVDGIVRLHNRSRKDGTVPIVHIYGGATYLRADSGVVQIVKVEQYVGDDWGEGSETRDKAQAALDAFHDRLREAVNGLGLIVAGGAHELA